MSYKSSTRQSETKYGFVILAGDMIFKDFFVGVKLLLQAAVAAINGLIPTETDIVRPPLFVGFVP